MPQLTVSDEGVLDGVVPMFPKGLNVMTNIAALVSDGRDRDLDYTHLIVIKPTPDRRPMSTHNCQNSGLFRSARPVISIHE